MKEMLENCKNKNNLYLIYLGLCLRLQTRILIPKTISSNSTMTGTTKAIMINIPRPENKPPVLASYQAKVKAQPSEKPK
jgi:hypothetical protein